MTEDASQMAANLKELASAVSELKIARARLEQKLEIMQQQFVDELRKIYDILQVSSTRERSNAHIQELYMIENYVK